MNSGTSTESVASGGASFAGMALQEDRWRTASRSAMINCVFFLILAASIDALKPQSLVIILSASAVFFAGSLLTFALMIRSGAVFAPIAWFVFGAGIYFGLGGVAGGLHVHPYSEQVFAGDILYLTRVNLLNACSVLVVVGVALLYAKMTEGTRRSYQGASSQQIDLLQKSFPYLLAVAIVGVCSRFVVFPIADDLLLRSILGKIYFLVPTCFLLLGVVWRRVGRPFQAIALTTLVLEIFSGLVAFNKYQIVYPMLALGMGMWMLHPSWRSIFLTLAGLLLVFSIINPIITLGRAHLLYDPQKNTLANRWKILRDAAAAYWNPDFEFLTVADGQIVRLDGISRAKERARAIGRRFEVASIQGYLISEYNNGRPGNTLSEFWVTFIPRMLWPDKPVITRLGGELNAKYFNDPTQAGSALAPTYSAEAYWNYGPRGVLLVSVLLGLAIGWLTHYSFLAISGARPEYFIIAFPAAVWACFVESWLVSSYLGEFVIFFAFLSIARIMMKFHDYWKTRIHGCLPN